jgi:hypothetical protein
MTIKSKLALSLATIALLSFTGCGSSDSSSDDNNNNSTTTEKKSDVTVVDGYVTNARVCDVNNVCANTNGNGVATAAFDLTNNLTATGGFIDLNGNGVQDDNEISAPTMQVPAGKTIISPLTDLIVKGVNPTKLAEVLGVSVEDLYADPIATNNVELAKAMQIVYAANTASLTNEVIKKINDYNVAVEEATEEPVEDTTTKSALPLRVLNSVAETDSNTTEETSTEEETNSSNSNGSLTVFAELVKSVAPDNTILNDFIQNVIETNVEKASEIESAIATEKQTIEETYATAPATAEDSNVTPPSSTTVTDSNQTNVPATPAVDTTTTNETGSALPL